MNTTKRKPTFWNPRVPLSGAALLIMLCLSGCVSPSWVRPVPAAETRQLEVQNLSNSLLALGQPQAPEETREIAQVAVLYPLDLADQYKLVWPPAWHNVMVNTGLRERGLCYQFADDLLAQLNQLKVQNYRFYYVVAHENSLMRAHYAIAVGHEWTPFEDRILLDAWRHSGRLYWKRVGDDKMPWEPYLGR